MRRSLPLVFALLSASAFGQALPNTTSSGSSPCAYGTFAALPSPTPSGRICIVSSSPSTWLADGSAWHPVIAGHIVGTQPKAASNFSVFNSGGSIALSDRTGALHFDWPPDGSASGTGLVRGFQESLSSSTAHVEAIVAFDQPSALGTASFPTAGIMMKESGTGKIYTLAVAEYNSNSTHGGGLVIEEAVWASTTSRTAATDYQLNLTAAPPCLKIARVSTNIVAQVSTDCTNWKTISTRATTSVFTSSPDLAGLAAVQWSSGGDNASFDVFHYLSGA